MPAENDGQVEPAGSMFLVASLEVGHGSIDVALTATSIDGLIDRVERRSVGYRDDALGQLLGVVN